LAKFQRQGGRLDGVLADESQFGYGRSTLPEFVAAAEIDVADIRCGGTWAIRRFTTTQDASTHLVSDRMAAPLPLWPKAPRGAPPTGPTFCR